MTAAHRAPVVKDGGFTLIELIVIIGIMSVLMALAVPAYTSLQRTVQSAATQADLGNDRIAIVSWGVDNNGLVPAQSGFDPSSSGLNLVGYGWSRSVETTAYSYLVNSAGTGWCLQMTSTSGSVFRVSQNHETAAGTCAALSGY